MDAEKTYSKLAILTTITATLTSTVTAQLSGNSQIPGTGFVISDVINLMLFWDLGSGAGFWLGLTMFIVTWLGFHFATKPFLQQLYDSMLDHFPSSGSRRSNLYDEGEEIKSVTMLSLLATFATAQVIGQLFGLIPLLIIGFIPAVLVAWGTWKSGGRFQIDFGNEMSDSDNTNQGNQNLDEELEEMKDELKDELGREEDIKQKISRLRGEQEDFDAAAEELVQSGNLPDDVQNDLEYLRQEMDDELQKENSLAEILDQVVGEEETEIEELNNVEDLAKYIEREFSHLMEMDRDLDQRLEELRAELEDIRDRENQDGSSEEVREEIADFNEKLEATKAEIQEAVSEAQDASQKADEAMAELEQLDQQTAQTEDEVEEAEEEDEQVKSEAMDEDERYDAVMQKMREYQDKIREADRERWQEDMREIHGAEELEEEVAEEEDTEVNEAYDEMMKIDQEKQKTREIIEEDKRKIAQLEEDLREKTDEVQELEETAFNWVDSVKKEEMEAEEFNSKLDGHIEELEKLAKESENSGDNRIYLMAEKILSEIEELRDRMPPEIQNREEGNYLKNRQERIYEAEETLYDNIDSQDVRIKFKNMVDELTHPILVRDTGDNPFENLGEDNW